MNWFWKKIYKRKALEIRQHRINPMLIEVFFPLKKKSLRIDLATDEFVKKDIHMNFDLYHCATGKDIDIWSTHNNIFLVIDVYNKQTLVATRIYCINVLEARAE